MAYAALKQVPVAVARHCQQAVTSLGFLMKPAKLDNIMVDYLVLHGTVISPSGLALLR